MQRTLALLLSAAFLASPAAAADRNYSVASFERIRVDGPFEIKLVTGVSPYARASGDVNAIDRISLAVEGRTLVVKQSSDGWGGYPGQNRGRAVIEVGTPNLTNAFINGAGRLIINKVRGLSFDLSIQGAGSAEIADVDIDQLKVGLAGVAGARLTGKALNVQAVVRGTSSLDATALRTRDIKLAADGAAVARMNVASSAKIDALGPVTIDIAGSPACTVKAQGSSTITGC